MTTPIQHLPNIASGNFFEFIEQPTDLTLTVKLHALEHLASIALGQELGGWQENEDLVHQVTVGLQWIHPRLVLEGGIVRDFSNGDETLILLSTRVHF